MTAELRWILLLLGLPLLIGIWWWGARRSSQAHGDAALREPSAGDSSRHDPMRHDPMRHDSIGASAGHDPVRHDPNGASAGRDWGVPPFEPLSIRTADFESVPVLDGPMLVSASRVEMQPLAADLEPNSSQGMFDAVHDMGPHLHIHDEAAATTPAEHAPLATEQALIKPLPIKPALITEPAPMNKPPLIANPAPIVKPAPLATAPLAKPSTISPPAIVAKPAVAAQAEAHEEPGGRVSAASRAPNKAEKQRIVTIRVCAPGEVRWSGATLLNAFELHGLAYGRYHVFHRKHVDGQSVFCAASLVEPGTFDVQRMPAEQFRGLTLFAVLPGPVEPLLTVDELLSAARGLAAELSGMIQDSKGLPMSPQRAAALRDDIARFQAALSVA